MYYWEQINHYGHHHNLQFIMIQHQVIHLLKEDQVQLKYHIQLNYQKYGKVVQEYQLLQ